MEQVLPFIFTPGEPAGIGLDLAVQLIPLALQGRFKRPIILYTDPQALIERAMQLGQRNVTITPYDPHHVTPIACHPFRFTAPIVPGQLDSRHASCVLDAIRSATKTVLTRKAAALITGPVHKGIINEAGFAFTGHTELLAELRTGRINYRL